MTNATTELGWYDTVSAERALSILGYKTRPEWLTAITASSRAHGAWMANEREHYVAYRSLAAHLAAAVTR